MSQDIVPDIFFQSCSLLITSNEISRGSGFLLKFNEKLYFITAKHVIMNSTNGQLHEEMARLFTFSSVKGDFEPGPVLDLRLSKPKTLDNEIVSIEIGQYVNNGTEEEFSIAPEISESGMFAKVSPIALTERDLALDLPIQRLSPVYLFAFPSTYFKPASGPLKDEPLMRYGIVAGIQNRKFILDCSSYFGNSGGLAVAKIGEDFKGIGVINEFIPFVEELFSKNYPGKTMMTRYENSGLTIAMGIGSSSLSMLSPSSERGVRFG